MNKLLRSRLVRYFLIVIAGVLLFLGWDSSRIRWKEQVRLQSGELVIVARTAKFSENWIAGGGGGSFNKGMPLEVVQPLKGDNPTSWDARFVPILLDRDPTSHEW